MLDRPGAPHEEAIEKVVGQVREAGGAAIALGGDITDARHVREAAERCRQTLGPCESNAAISMPSALMVGKARLPMLSQQLALELADHGIRSNVVSPGLVRTPLSERFYQDNDVLKRRAELVPARRIAVPEDIADAVLFAASERASYVNGQEILVDGGLARNLTAMLPPGYAAQPRQ